MRVVALRPGDRILDLGCGNGLKSVAAWNHRDPVTGVDRLRRDRVLPMHPNFSYLRADVRDLSTIAPDSFDVVTSFGLLEHLDDAEAAAVLRESERIAPRWVHVVPHRLAFVEPHVRLPLFGAWPRRIQQGVARWRRRGRPQERPLRIWWRSATQWRDLAHDPGIRVDRHWYGPLLVSALVHGRRRPPE